MPQTLGEYLAAKIQAAVAGAIRDVQGELEEVASKAGGGGGGSPFGDVGSLTGILSTALLGGVLLSNPEALPALAGAEAVEGAAGKLGSGIGLGWVLGSVLSPVVAPFLLPVVHAANAATTNEIFDPATVAALAAARITGTWKPGDEAAGGGIDSDHLAALVEAELSYPSLEVGLEMLRRGIITPPDLTLFMNRSKVPAQYQPQLAQLSRQLLAPAELALNVLRGFQTQDQAATYAAQLGITAADFQTLIDNTGEPPGPSQLLEAYRRDIIKVDRLERGIRQSRVRPEWIDVIEALRYQPMSVSDAVNAAVQNHLPKDQASQLAQEAGLNPDHFQTLYENHGRPLSRTEMTTLYHRGLATPDEFDQALRESDLKDKYIAHAFELRRVLIPARQITTAIAHGAMDAQTGISYLMMQGYTEADAGILVKTGTAEHHATLKDLSKTDITALYTDHLMPRSEAHAHLVKLGYTDQVADWILGLADARKQASLARALNSQVKALLQKGDIGKEDAISELVKGGVGGEDARALVDEWTLLHGTPTRQLSEAQIVKAAKSGLVEPRYAYARLQGLGYDKTDATVLLMIAGFTPDQFGSDSAPRAPAPPPPPPGGPTGPPPVLPPR